jgi:hypothetical protein
MFELRRKIGDDPNRIRLDMRSKKRMTQVLFTSKKVKKRYKNENI